MTFLFADNPLCTRRDLQVAVRELFVPLKAHFSPGCARVRLGRWDAHYPQRVAELEAFARPLWGLAPLAAGGGDFADWALYRQGLIHGTDPEHPEYWGTIADYGQEIVEMAAVGCALALTPEQLWEPLDSRARANLIRWLARINRTRVYGNNWLWFPVLVNLGLARIGASEYDPTVVESCLARLDTFYLGSGWYSDGATMQRDYYGPFAMHFYGLLYARLAGDRDPGRTERLRQRAALFAGEFVHWFAADGAALPFGRSLTYRFAQGAFWGALAYGGVAALDWGVIKGLALRHLRWWATRPITRQDGCLTIGYTYPNSKTAEAYNAPGSPYWALKFFLPLALPETHPFWQAEEKSLPELSAKYLQPQAGMILCRDPASVHVFALSSGQQLTANPNVWHSAEKYSKFAYSTAFGFSIPSDFLSSVHPACDSMLVLSDESGDCRWREAPLEAVLEGDVLRSRWKPWPDVTVETWLLGDPPWHVRIHRLRTARRLVSTEGGFALARPAAGFDECLAVGQGKAFARAACPLGLSGLRDLQGARRGEIVHPDLETNLLHPRTVLPVLLGDHAPGTHWLVCAVLGQPGEQHQHFWESPPPLPPLPPETPGTRFVIYQQSLRHQLHTQVRQLLRFVSKAVKR